LVQDFHTARISYLSSMWQSRNNSSPHGFPSVDTFLELAGCEPNVMLAYLRTMYAGVQRKRRSNAYQGQPLSSPVSRFMTRI
jgi:hypothetical protein